MAQFMHPNIVRVFGSVDKGKYLILCMYVLLASMQFKYCVSMVIQADVTTNECDAR